MTSLRVIFIKLYGNFFSKKIFQKAIKRLSYKDDNFSNIISKTLESLVNRKFTHEEKQQFTRIEQLRQKTKSSNEIIAYTKFGESGNANTHDQVPLKKFAQIGKSGDWALMLFKLIQFLRPSICLELGTCLGFSALYQASALQLNKEGRLITLDGQPVLIAKAKENAKRLNIQNIEFVSGLFQDTLHGVLERLNKIDFAFIDGHHDEQATLNYFDQIFPHLSDGAIIVFDDISWSSGMRRAWNTISNDSRVLESLDLFVLGICMIR